MALKALMAQHFPAGSRAPRSFPPEVRLNRVSTCPRKVRRTADPSAALGMTKERAAVHQGWLLTGEVSRSKSPRRLCHNKNQRERDGWAGSNCKYNKLLQSNEQIAVAVAWKSGK